MCRRTNDVRHEVRIIRAADDASRPRALVERRRTRAEEEGEERVEFPAAIAHRSRGEEQYA